MSDKKIIIGLGTGRCGTQSLVALLNQYPDTHIDHERFPIESTWLPNLRYFNNLCHYFEGQNATIVGDVSFYNLNYFYLFTERYKDIKFIGLRRNKNQTVHSYFKKTEGRNHFAFPHKYDEHRLWDKKFPKFLDMEKETALRAYYDFYYGQLYYLQHVFPGTVKVFDVADLNSQKGVEDIFKFLELDKKYLDENFIHVKKNIAMETKTHYKPTRSDTWRNRLKNLFKVKRTSVD
ncbi:MAG: hypothetical protein GF313_10990 [Caldithrix sp.]|nr:hypothetical protein [Caldithrix sp.]